MTTGDGSDQEFSIHWRSVSRRMNELEDSRFVDAYWAGYSGKWDDLCSDEKLNFTIIHNWDRLTTELPKSSKIGKNHRCLENT